MLQSLLRSRIENLSTLHKLCWISKDPNISESHKLYIFIKGFLIVNFSRQQWFCRGILNQHNKDLGPLSFKPLSKNVSYLIHYPRIRRRNYTPALLFFLQSPSTVNWTRSAQVRGGHWTFKPPCLQNWFGFVVIKKQSKRLFPPIFL